ncbi:MAG TPA: transcriptional repressor [Ktedonosporobacter sp.]|nr:transcriptional repressor [Ktedonosporobacter sp.]
MEKMRLNANVRAVLDVLQSAESHPTAQEVYESVRKVRPSIGVATVYRILNQLGEQGMVKVLGRESECRYDARTQRHDHAVCTECGALLDIPVEITLSNEVLARAAQAAGIRLDSHEIRIYGRCLNCDKG